MNKLNINGVVRSLVALAATLVLGQTHAVTPTPTVVLSGPAASVAPGDEFAVSMAGQGFGPTVGGGANLSFAAGLLELLSVQIDPGWDFLPDGGLIDNNVGTLTDMSFNVWGSRMGDFPIATLQFKAKGVGILGIDALDSALYPFSDDDGNPVLVRYLATSVEVSNPIPEPSAWLLLLGGLGALAALASRRNSAHRADLRHRGASRTESTATVG
jgi:hypothetical protein